MAVIYEFNPPRTGGPDEGSVLESRMERMGPMLKACGGVHVTDSVLGRQRMDPVAVARRIRKDYPDIGLTVSMRTTDRSMNQIIEFARAAGSAGVDGILVVKGDPAPGAADSGNIPSAVARSIAGHIQTYLSIPSRPDFAKIKKKIEARPRGFVTQIVSDAEQVRRIAGRLRPEGFRVMPCVLIPSEKNAKSAQTLGIDWSSYENGAAGFVKEVHQIAGDVLVTSPNDFDAALQAVR